ncbi:MAG: hypothetical protein ACRDLU_01345 [Gaiellaceae bacterium]
MLRAGTPGPATDGQAARDTAMCLPGEKAIGGGWDQDRGGLGYVIADRPVPDGSGWRVHVFGAEANDLPAPGTMWAVCLKVS